MNDKAPTTLDRLWDHIPTGIAPIGNLLSAGHAAKRRKRQRVIAGTVAASALVLGGGIVAQQTLMDGPGNDVTAADPHDITVVLGQTRLVGIGQVAIAVPADWADNAASCNTPIMNTVFFPWPQDCQILAITPPVSSVAITDGEFTETGTKLDDLHPAGSVEGHRSREEEITCDSKNGVTVCNQTFGIPSENAYFTATLTGDSARERLNAIRDSLTFLPPDQTTVPFTPLGGVTETTRALEAAGLSVYVVQTTRPPIDSCLSGCVDIEPAVGRMVPVGSTVTITVLSD